MHPDDLSLQKPGDVEGCVSDGHETSDQSNRRNGARDICRRNHFSSSFLPFCVIALLLLYYCCTTAVSIVSVHKLQRHRLILAFILVYQYEISIELQ